MDEIHPLFWNCDSAVGERPELLKLQVGPLFCQAVKQSAFASFSATNSLATCFTIVAIAVPAAIREMHSRMRGPVYGIDLPSRSLQPRR